MVTLWCLSITSVKAVLLKVKTLYVLPVLSWPNTKFININDEFGEEKNRSSISNNFHSLVSDVCYRITIERQNLLANFCTHEYERLLISSISSLNNFQKNFKSNYIKYFEKKISLFFSSNIFLTIITSWETQK